jgi:predicted dehydrogenase
VDLGGGAGHEGQEGERSVMASTVGVGVLGSGFMGRTWSEAIRAAEGAHLVAVAGGSRASALARDYDVPELRVGELIEHRDVGLVIVATPPNVHPEQAEAVARAGKHVLIEKPLANNLRDADRIREAFAASRTALAVVSQHRFRKAPLAAKDAIRAGRIGDVRMIRVIGPTAGYDAPNDDWKADPTIQTVWADWAAHACDITRWFADSDATLAFAQSASYQPDPPPAQSTFAVYRFANDVLADIWLTYEIPEPGLGSALQFLITGSAGMLRFDSYGEVELGDADGWQTIYRQPPFDPTDPLNPIRLRAYADQLEDLLAAVREGRQPQSNGETARKTIEMVEAAELAIKTGEAIHLPLRPATPPIAGFARVEPD